MSTEAASTPQDRYQAAMLAFEEVNRVLPAGLQPFTVPETFETAALVNGLSALLVQKGLVTEQEMVDAKTGAMAELMENITEQAKSLKGQGQPHDAHPRPLDHPPQQA